jgi:hypothetical protein
MSRIETLPRALIPQFSAGLGGWVAVERRQGDPIGPPRHKMLGPPIGILTPRKSTALQMPFRHTAHRANENALFAYFMVNMTNPLLV